MRRGKVKGWRENSYEPWLRLCYKEMSSEAFYDLGFGELMGIVEVVDEVEGSYDLCHDLNEIMPIIMCFIPEYVCDC
jgi:hypothetical protein